MHACRCVKAAAFLTIKHPASGPAAARYAFASLAVFSWPAPIADFCGCRLKLAGTSRLPVIGGIMAGTAIGDIITITGFNDSTTTIYITILNELSLVLVSYAPVLCTLCPPVDRGIHLWGLLRAQISVSCLAARLLHQCVGKVSDDMCSHTWEGSWKKAIESGPELYSMLKSWNLAKLDGIFVGQFQHFSCPLIVPLLPPYAWLEPNTYA